jgi:uncharacterized repeat protein (TIGR01451 family)
MLALFAGSTVPATTMATTFQGVKFNDLNGNGVQDRGEKGVPHETIFIRYESSQGDRGFSTVDTDANGLYSINISTGSTTNYALWSDIPTDWKQTMPVEGEGMQVYQVTGAPNAGLDINFGVCEIPCVVEEGRIIVDAGLNQTIDAGDKVRLKGSFTDTQGSEKHEVVVEFGDGNSATKVIANDATNSSRRSPRDGKVTTEKVDATNTFLEAGTFENEVTVKNAEGKVGTDKVTVTVKDAAKSDPCATGIPNVQSTTNGAWFDKNTWSPVGVPTKDDWVIIKTEHTVTMPRDMTSSFDTRGTTTGLCVKGTLQSAPNSLGLQPTLIMLRPKTLHNQGKILGSDGIDGSGPLCRSNAYQHASGGSNIIIEATKVINDGQIRSGKGGTDPIWMYMNDGCALGFPSKGGDGGPVEIYTSLFRNNGQIQSGDGGFSDRAPGRGRGVHNGKSEGGNGGLIRITGKHSDSANTGKIILGNGGDAERNGGKAIPGCAGNTPTCPDGTNNSGWFNYPNHNGEIEGKPGSVIAVDPTTMKFGPNTRISGADEVNIYGGEDWVMEVNNLAENAITAAKQITFAVGSGGVIDFRGSAPNAIKAGVCNSAKSLDVVYVLDTSNSMTYKLSDGQRRIEAAKQAIIALNASIAQQNNGSQVALVTFESGARVSANFTNDIGSINEIVTQLKLRHGTRLHKATDVTNTLLGSRQNAENLPVVILFSDGATSKSAGKKSLDNLKAAVPNVLIHSVGIGNSAATSVLQYAVTVGGQYYSANDTASLTTALQQALEKTVCPQAETAEVRIFADDVLLDDGVSLETLIDAPKIIQGPAKILYNAAWSGVGYLEDKPGVTLPIALTLLNGGPIPDTYNISVRDSAGWTLSELPATTTVNGLRRTELEMSVTLPDTHGAQDVITVTATSQSDSSVVATLDINVGVEPSDDGTGGTGSETNPVIGNLKANGTIHDKFGDPIIGALVRVDDKAAVTDINGSWEIKGLTEGNYPVTVINEGYIFTTKNCVVGNQQDCQPRITASSELAIKAVANPRILKQGENLTYLITVTNNGEQTATGLKLADTLPTNAKLISINPIMGGSCDTETVTCALPDLTTGATAQVEVVVSNTQADKLVNIAEISADEYPAEMAKTVTTIKPDLSVSITDSPNPVSMQGNLHYTVDVELSQYAKTAATGVELVSYLPKGVELQAVNTDYGVCDTSKFPTVTCSLADMSVDSADSVSHIAVDFDVLLNDPGLLLLTHEAKVTANEYPAHTDRERTKISVDPNIKVDMIFVIDNSNSMQEEIDGVIAAIKKFIATVDSNSNPFIALVTFKDEVIVKAATSDLDILLEAVENIKVSGGGMCPEASAEALELAIKHLKDNGVILLATDASPYDDADIESLMELIRSKAMKLNVMLTGDCVDKNHWNALPSDK